MRVGFFGQTGPYAPFALTELLATPMPYTIALVVEGRRGGRPEHKLREPGKSRPQGSSLADQALAAGLTALQSTDINDPGAIDVLAEFDLDFIVCVGFDRLFKPAVLEQAKRGGINAHPSDLPRLRGPAPLFWALKEGRKYHTLTLHGLDAREDHGPIYAKESFAPSSLATGDVIFRMAGVLAGKMLVPLLAKAVDEELVGVAQDHSKASRAPRPKPEDAYVDPLKWSSEALVRFACGAPYFRAPWMRFGDATFFVRRGLKADVGKRVPGDYSLHGDHLVVQCRDGSAHLEIQI